MDNAVVLSVGDVFHLKKGKDRIIYAGMPSDTVYSIAQRKSDGYQGYAWNLFYSKKKSEITIDGVRIFVENVTPDEIRIKVG
ncbi:hypothetical protein ACFLVE_04105 [Chloroflexota bacterium]